MYATIIVTQNLRKSSVESRKDQSLAHYYLSCTKMTCAMFPNYFILFYLQMILNMFYSASNIDDVTNVVNNELKQLGLWFRVNKLSLNVNKTNVIMFNNKKQHRTDVYIVLNGTNIEQVTHTKFFGVTIVENLTWREHILDCQALHTLYQSLVEPHMSYCCEITGSTYQSKKLKKLFLLQKKTIQIICNLNYHDHTSVFFHSSKILKLHDLVTYKTMIIL